MVYEPLSYHNENDSKFKRLAKQVIIYTILLVLFVVVMALPIYNLFYYGWIGLKDLLFTYLIIFLLIGFVMISSSASSILGKKVININVNIDNNKNESL
jgi:O-antigen/teichoic acid export membrane protein